MKNEAEDKAELESLILRRVKVFEDGSYLLVGEQETYYSPQRRPPNPLVKAQMVEQRHFNDLLAFKIKKDGTMAWIKKLPKQQTGSSDIGDMSFFTFSNDEAHYFLYADEKDNLNLGFDEKPRRHLSTLDSYLIAYKINDKDGVVIKIGIGYLNDFLGYKIYHFNVHGVEAISEKEIIFDGYVKDNEDAFFKIKFD